MPFIYKHPLLAANGISVALGSALLLLGRWDYPITLESERAVHIIGTSFCFGVGLGCFYFAVYLTLTWND